MNLLDAEESLSQQKKYPRFFKSPIEVKWNITGRCTSNCGCSHCYRQQYSESARKDLTHEELTHISKEIISNEVIRVIFSGGEPLLRREELREIIPMLYNENIMMSIETNGLELTEADIDFFSRYGVGIILGVYLNDGSGADHEYIEKIINVLRRIKERTDGIKVNYLVDKNNIKQLQSTIDAISAIGGISAIEVHTVVMRGRAQDNKDYKLSSDDYNQVLNLIAVNNERHGKESLCIFKDHSFHLQNLMTMETGNYLAVIENDGSVKASEWLPVSFGNIIEESLEDIWVWGLNSCWADKRMKLLLKDMKNINKLGIDIENKTGNEIDFFAL